VTEFLGFKSDFEDFDAHKFDSSSRAVVYYRSCGKVSLLKEADQDNRGEETISDTRRAVPGEVARRWETTPWFFVPRPRGTFTTEV
jgi:hypothetical protein